MLMADNLVALLCRLSGNSGNLNFLESSGLSSPVKGNFYRKLGHKSSILKYSLTIL